MEARAARVNALNIDFKTTRLIWSSTCGVFGWLQKSLGRTMGEGIRGVVVYNTDLFDEATITRMLGYFKTLLRGLR